MLTQAEGEFLVKLARRTIETYLKTGEIIKPPKNTPKKLRKKCGVFVTLDSYPSELLRGCIGVPQAIKPLVDACIDSAISSATKDPRFPRVELRDMDSIVIEVSVLTQPELIEVKNPKEYLEKIEPGKDGLILKLGFNSGLFLPQVWEQIPEKEDFLAQLCYKAGLMDPSAWMEKDAKLYKFNVEAFKEEKPRGAIKRH